MPYTTKGECIYKKDTGKKVGCTKGSVKKYMAALHTNVKEGMMKKFNEISKILRESEEISSEFNTSNPPVETAPEMHQDEKARRHRMMKRMAALGVAAGAGVTAGELMLSKGSRGELKQALNLPGWKQKIFAGAKGVEHTPGYHPGGVVKQVWKPMALGMGADLAVEPVNTAIAQKMEDRLQKKKDQTQAQNI